MTIFKSFSRFTLFVLFVSTFSSAVMAAEDKAAELIRERLLAARPDIPILDIQPAQIPGFYDVYLPAG
ncbi:MAG: hypothetical protein ACJAYW_001898, partial [Candidatus Azotimanducaceae bacterium]